MTRIGVLLLAILSGCATSHVAQIESLEKAKLCCRDVHELPILGSLDTEIRVSLNGESPVFGFATGRSYFYGFALPKKASPYELELRALPMGRASFEGTMRGGQQYLFPAVLFLDEQRRPLGTAYDEKLKAECYSFGCTYTFAGSVKVPPEARYGVLHTLYGKVGQDYQGLMQHPSGGFMAGGLVVLYPGGPSTLLGRFGGAGDVVVKVK